MLGQQILDIGIVRARGDDRVARGDLANGSGYACLDARPPVRIVDLRLVHDLEEDPLGVA